MNTITNMNIKKLIWVIGALFVLVLVVASLMYFPKPTIEKIEQPEKKVAVGAVGAVGEVSKSVPKIVTNPAEKVPEVNPLDRANPFKYNNPLR